MKLILPAVLQLLGYAVVIAEIFIPSMGLLSAIALGIFAYSLYLVYTGISINAGVVLTILDMVLVPVFVILGMKVMARSSLALQRQLSKEDGIVSQKEDLKAYLNQEGTAVTDLRPSGSALINECRLDVVTDGEYIESGSSVVVTQVAGNRIIVEKTEE